MLPLPMPIKAEVSLFGDNWEFTTLKRNHCKNARAPRKPESYWIVAPWLVD